METDLKIALSIIAGTFSILFAYGLIVITH
ncbi:YnhF family membrane protein [Vibrio sp. 10N.286.49.B3]|nr:YnhF family membrane protein [Vibrio sp. 10N.286.49.B3]